MRSPRIEISPELARAIVADADRLALLVKQADMNGEVPVVRPVQPKIYPCGCTAIKVSMNRCDVYQPSGEPRVQRLADLSPARLAQLTPPEREVLGAEAEAAREVPVRDTSRMPATACGYTYGMLLHDLLELSREQLDSPVRWWGEEIGGRMAGLDLLDQDFVQGEEGCYPASEFEPTEEEPEPVVVLPKGTPILEVV